MEKRICPICGHEFTLVYSGKRIYVDSESILKTLAVNNPSLLVEFKGGTIDICEDCFDEFFYHCDGCDETHPYNELCRCYTDRVMDHDNKRIQIPEFKGHVKYKDLRFGIELESEYHGTWMSRRKALLGFTQVLGKGLCKFKYDGSLRNKGVEFVSMPMYFEHFQTLRAKFRKALEGFKREGGYSYGSENTGVHIHLSRAAFISTEHLYQFFMGICQNPRFTHRIARRGSNVFCKHPTMVRIDGTSRHFPNVTDAAEKMVNGRLQTTRYQWVNLNNEKTVEVRVYKGDLRWDNVVTYIQHAYSMFEYTMLLALNKMKFDVEGYRRFVKRNARFAELAKVI